MQQFTEGQTRTRRSTGEVQEFRNGNWITVKQGSGPQPMMSVQTRGADPMLPGKLQGQQLDNRQTQVQTDRVIQMTPAELQKATADAARAEAERQKAVIEAQNAETSAENKKKGDEASRAQLTQLISNLDALQKDAADGGGWFETGATGAMLRNRPGTAAYDLMSRVKGIQGSQFIEALRQLKSQSQSGSTGAGGLTEQEGERILSATGNLDPNQSQQQFLDMIGQAREAALGGYRRVGGNDPQVDPSLDRSSALPGTSDRTSGMGLSKGDTKAEVDPILQAVGSRVGQLLSQGVPDGKVMQFLRDNGVDPSVTNINSALQARKTPQFKAWQRANPGKAYPIGPEFYTKQVPMTAAQQYWNRNAQDPTGVGAYFANAAQAMSGNTLDGIGGEQVNTGLEMLRTEHPVASLAGDATGTALLDTLTPGLSKLGMFAQPVKDAAIGAFQGFGEGNTVGGAAANTLGGIFGRGLHGAAHLAASGVKTTPSLAYLRDANVPLTPGYIARGTNTTLGDSIANLEDRAAGLPVTDAIINSARQRGQVGFNQEMFNQIGQPASIPGNGSFGIEGLINARGARNKAYSFLDGARLARDPEYAAQTDALNASLPSLPDFGDKVGRKLGLVERGFGADGDMTGRNWQQSIRTLRGERGKLAGQPFGEDAANALGAAEGNLSGLVERQLPGGSQQLANANAVNANFKTAQAALKGRVAQRAGVLTDPTTLNDVSLRGAIKFGGIDNAMEGNYPFADLARAGMDVMPNEVPDSGTAGRSLLYSILYPSIAGGAVGGGVGAATGGDASEGAATGAGITTASTFLPTALLAAAYSKPGQKMLTKALIGPRSKAATKLGDFLAGESVSQTPLMQAIQKGFGKKALGQYGGATLRDLLLLPELPNNYNQ